MATSIDLEPIRNLKPLNKGGVVARGGFCFQDHIAVNFCLEMIVEPRLEEVWCETHDDITLIWCENEVEKVEFVQVKDYDRDTLWSLPRLCQREERREGTSILERSLAEARCQEPCMFRIVTSLGVKDELKILTYDFSSPFRKEHQSEYINLSEKIRGKLGHLISPKGYQVDYWLANTLWQIEHNIGAIYNKNINALSRIISNLGYNLNIGVIENKVYSPLLLMVKQTAEHDPDVDLNAKRITKNKITNLIKELVDGVLDTKRGMAGAKIVEKMERAKIMEDYIETALEERRRYRKARLETQYLELSDHELVEGEILSCLQKLRLDLDLGNIEPGLPFYKLCLETLDILRKKIGTGSTAPTYYYHGCMHDITDRCNHRYDRG